MSMPCDYAGAETLARAMTIIETAKMNTLTRKPLSRMVSAKSSPHFRNGRVGYG
jgi:hypothetical protein